MSNLLFWGAITLAFLPMASVLLSLWIFIRETRRIEKMATEEAGK